MPATAGMEIVRRIALRLALVLLFLRVSNLHQIQTALMGDVNLRLLYFVGTPALLGVALGGGFQRAFRGRPAYYWVAYAVWIALSVPFSSWPGGSSARLLSFLKSDLMMLFAVGGLAITWRECRAVMGVFAWAAVVNLASARLFADDDSQSRLSLEFGSIANANDFAAHLLLVLPFLLWVSLSSRWLIFRGAAMLGIAFGLYLILSTGSRGAVIGIVFDVLCFLLWGTTRQRLALLTAGAIGVASVVTLVPQDALHRSLAFTGGRDDVSLEAEASVESRKYLLTKSVQYAIEHPLFGVGLGLFANYEGVQSHTSGTSGAWHAAHNSFTQAASECGIPAMLLFVAGIVSTFRLVNATRREACRRQCEDIRNAAFCTLLGIVGFCAAMTFLSLAYTFYLPVMGGMAISIACAAKQEFAARATPSSDAPAIAMRQSARIARQRLCEYRQQRQGRAAPGALPS